MKAPAFLQRAAVALATVFTPVPLDPPPSAPIVAAGTPPPDVAPALARILRPQAAYRWLLPQLAAITPQYIESVLRGALTGDHVRAWELYDLMEDTWPRLRKNAMELKNGVRNLKPEFSEYTEEEGQPTPSATEKMKLVSAALRTMRPDAAADENALGGTISDIMDAWLKGVSVLEIDWQTTQAGKLGTVVAPRATFWVHPICYGWDSNGRLGLSRSPGVVTTGYEQSVSAVTEFPSEKFLVAIAKSKSGSALSGSLLRPLAWWWCAANFSADWLLNLAQVFGLPFRWANYDPNAPQATIDAICSMLQNMGSAGWAAFPAGTTLELKGEGQKADNSPQADMLDRADKNCDLLILGQTLTSDAGRSGKGGGSLALGKVHEGVKGDIITAAARFVVDVVEQQLFPAILRLNYGEDSECPSFALATEKEEDLAAKAGFIATLAEAGAGEIIGLDWLSKSFDIPKPGPTERTLADVAAEAEQQQQAGKKPVAVSAPDDGEALASKLSSLCEIKNDKVFARELLELSDAISAASGVKLTKGRGGVMGHWVTLEDGRHIFLNASKSRTAPKPGDAHGDSRIASVHPVHEFQPGEHLTLKGNRVMVHDAFMVGDGSAYAPHKLAIQATLADGQSGRFSHEGEGKFRRTFGEGGFRLKPEEAAELERGARERHAVEKAAHQARQEAAAKSQTESAKNHLRWGGESMGAGVKVAGREVPRLFLEAELSVRGVNKNVDWDRHHPYHAEVDHATQTAIADAYDRHKAAQTDRLKRLSALPTASARTVPGRAQVGDRHGDLTVGRVKSVRRSTRQDEEMDRAAGESHVSDVDLVRE